MTSHDDAIRELLLASVADIEGSVRANDTKANAALVVHGLLFAGMTTLLTRLGSVYTRANEAERVVGLGLLAVALGAFLTSVYFLLRSLSPYRNSAVTKALTENHARVFFPDLAGRSGDCVKEDKRFSVLKARVEQLKTSSDIVNELVAEIVKLDAIHRFESRNTGSGYHALRAELTAVAAFFVLVAIAAGVL